MPRYTAFVRTLPSSPSLQLEQALSACGRRLVAGIDEVGRGSWVGPVVAAAVVLPGVLPSALSRVRDSKSLAEGARERLFDEILDASVAIGIGWSSHHLIDRLGIAAANRAAMMRAVANLPVAPDALLIDAVHLPGMALPQICLPKGEAHSFSIAAASIVAKVVRDRWMVATARRFPGYSFERNKGYGTGGHREALLRLGPTGVHRRSFHPVSDFTS